MNAEVEALRCHSQVSAAILELSADGVIEFVEECVCALPTKVAVVAVDPPLDEARQRQPKVRLDTAPFKRRLGRVTPTARYVSNLAEQLGVIYEPSFCDGWASTVTRLSGDEITPDPTDDLLVALTRNGTLSLGELVKLAMNHHRALKSDVGCTADRSVT